MLTPSQIAQKIRNVLRRHGIEKISIRSEIECDFIELLVKNEPLTLIAWITPSQRIAVKLVPVSKSTSTLWGCEWAKYSPEGLYLIAESFEDIETYLPEKLDFILKTLNS